MANRTLLVTGAAGNLGRLILERLLEAKAGPIIATTRTPEKLADFAKRGVEVRQGDFSKPEGLVKAFAGAERLLLISTGDLFPEGLRLRQHRAAVQAAVDAGVKHVLYTSGPAPHPTAKGSLINDHTIGPSKRWPQARSSGRSCAITSTRTFSSARSRPR